MIPSSVLKVVIFWKIMKFVVAIINENITKPMIKKYRNLKREDSNFLIFIEIMSFGFE